MPRSAVCVVLSPVSVLDACSFPLMQMSVFSELLKFWPEFQELSSSIQEEHLLPLLQEKRVKHRARVRRQRRKEEEEDERMRIQVWKQKQMREQQWKNVVVQLLISLQHENLW